MARATFEPDDAPQAGELLGPIGGASGFETRPSRANGRATRKAMRETAVDLFYQHGYKSVSLRLLAKEVGLQAGSLYNHINTKQDLLFTLLKEIMEELLNSVRESVSSCGNVTDELRVFVEVHLAFHTRRLREVYIGNSELRNLESANRETVVKLRREYFELLHGIVSRGADQGVFVVDDTRVAARIIMGMLNGVTGWYRADGVVSAKNLTETYLRMIFGSLGASLIAKVKAGKPTASRAAQSIKRPVKRDA